MGPRQEAIENKKQAQQVVSRKYVPTAQQRAAVEAMSVVGTPIDIIADYIGVTPSVVKSAFADEMKHAKLERSLAIVNTIYNRALRGDSKLLMFWAKTQLGWKETVVQEHVLPTINIFTIDGNIERTIGPGVDVEISDAEFEDVGSTSEKEETNG